MNLLEKGKGQDLYSYAVGYRDDKRRKKGGKGDERRGGVTSERGREEWNGMERSDHEEFKHTFPHTVKSCDEESHTLTLVSLERRNEGQRERERERESTGRERDGERNMSE